MATRRDSAGNRAILGQRVITQWLSHLRGNGTAGRTFSTHPPLRKSQMFRKVRRLFVIKTRFEAFMIIYALALGAVERGSVYLTQYPGFGGKLLFLACTGAVFMAGAKILDCLKYEQAERAQTEAESRRTAN